jgi:hypothetical protein
MQGKPSYLTRYQRSLPVVPVDPALETHGFDTVPVDDHNLTGEAVQGSSSPRGSSSGVPERS